LKTEHGAESDSLAERNLVKTFATSSSNEAKTKASAMKVRYQGRIMAAEQELCSWAAAANQSQEDSSRSEMLDSNAEALKFAIRALAYETDMAQERIKVEEARDALWAVWSEAAGRKSTHRPKEQSITTALSLFITTRRKLTSAVQSYVNNEEKETSNARIPAWLKNEPSWPTGIKQDAWWPMRTSSDTEKTLVALVGAANRAVKVAREGMSGRSAATAEAGPHETRGKVAFIAAQEAQQGSGKVISDLNTASNHLKQLSGHVRR
jgi:hypothetical protein